jgi:very-short-patch-repair endonuclease
MTARDLDATIAALASRQHNVFTRVQALSLGATGSLVQRRVATGAWLSEGHGVYGLPGAVQTWPRRLMIAHLDLGSDSVVSHRSAAALHRFPSARAGTPELTVPAGGKRSGRWRVHEAAVEGRDRARVDALPATTVVRTALDLAGVLPPAALEAVVDGLLAEGRLRLGPFSERALVHRRRGRRGSAALGALLEERGPGYVPPASELEALLFEVLRAGGLPSPVRQHPLPSLHEPGRVDAAYPEYRLIVEVDGRRWHTRVADFERDRRRDIDAGLLGWRVVRFVWGDLVRQPAWVCHVVAAHLSLAA